MTRHLIPISGKDSAATALTQKARRPDLTYEYIFNDTFAELPENERWLYKMERHLGKRIKRIGKNLEEIIAEQGILPSQHWRFCTRKAKIHPMEEFIGDNQAIIYLGLRADETNRIGYVPNPKFDITPAYPLQDIGITLPLVWEILEQRDLLPPAFFWQEIYERTIDRLKHLQNHLQFNAIELLDQLKPWQHRTLFAWRSRNNCYFCFNQRLYEWIGLYDHEPLLYWHAAAIERRTGAKNFTWNRDYSLLSLMKRAEQIRTSRVDQITKAIIHLGQNQLFHDLDAQDDILSVTSCGLFCGK